MICIENQPFAVEYTELVISPIVHSPYDDEKHYKAQCVDNQLDDVAGVHE